MHPELDPAKVTTLLGKVGQRRQNVQKAIDRLVAAGTDPHAAADQSHMVDIRTILQGLFPGVSAEAVNSRIVDGNISEAFKQLAELEGMDSPEKERRRRLGTALREVTLRTWTGSVEAEVAHQLWSERSGAKFECSCCLESCSVAERVKCPAGHAVCAGCLVRAVETVLGEGRTEVRCLGEGSCGRPYDMVELEAHVPYRTRRRWFTTEGMKALGEVDLADVARCPSCGFAAVVEGLAVFECPECGVRTCPRCRQEPHPGVTCEAAAAALEAQREVAEREEAAAAQAIEAERERAEAERERAEAGRQRARRRPVRRPRARVVGRVGPRPRAPRPAARAQPVVERPVKTCPKCEAPGVKETGCNAITCPRCGQNWCYVCGRGFPDDAQAHNHGCKM
jgi:predicted RNA-binding Zn-ribbon protein involved in translation (DUF1610 family)